MDFSTSGCVFGFVGGGRGDVVVVVVVVVVVMVVTSIGHRRESHDRCEIIQLDPLGSLCGPPRMSGTALLGPCS